MINPEEFSIYNSINSNYSSNCKQIEQIFRITKIKNKKKWSCEDDSKLIKLANNYNEKHWKEISFNFENKNSLQCFARYRRIKPGIIKGNWSQEEDNKICSLVEIIGKSWSKISKIIGTRNGKQIRDRYINVLDPSMKKGKFSELEDRLLIELYFKIGPKWAEIAKHFMYRTADMIKNRFHSSIKREINKHFGSDVVTRKRNLLQKPEMLADLSEQLNYSSSITEENMFGNPSFNEEAQNKINNKRERDLSFFLPFSNTNIDSNNCTPTNKVSKTVKHILKSDNLKFEQCNNNKYSSNIINYENILSLEEFYKSNSNSEIINESLSGNNYNGNGENNIENYNIDNLFSF